MEASWFLLTKYWLGIKLIYLRTVCYSFVIYTFKNYNHVQSPLCKLKDVLIKMEGCAASISDRRSFYNRCVRQQVPRSSSSAGPGTASLWQVLWWRCSWQATTSQRWLRTTHSSTRTALREAKFQPRKPSVLNRYYMEVRVEQNTLLLQLWRALPPPPPPCSARPPPRVRPGQGETPAV